MSIRIQKAHKFEHDPCGSRIQTFDWHYARLGSFFREASRRASLTTCAKRIFLYLIFVNNYCDVVLTVPKRRLHGAATPGARGPVLHRRQSQPSGGDAVFFFTYYCVSQEKGLRSRCFLSGLCTLQLLGRVHPNDTLAVHVRTGRLEQLEVK